MNFLVPPWQHQLEAIQRAKGRDAFALFFEQGTGKTSTTINMLRQLFNEKKRVMRTLIFGPPIVVENWVREFAVHAKMPPGRVVPLQGAGVKRLETFRRRTDGTTEGCIFITNYEALLMEPLFKAMQAWKPEIVVFDESHKLKTHSSKRTKKAIALVDSGVRYRYLLTGTPILNSPLDIFGQFRVLDGGQTFDRNFFVFRQTFFYDANAAFKAKKSYFPNWQIRAGALEEMNKKIYTKAMRVLKKDCLDLPPLVRQKVYVELSPAQQKHYEEMKRDLVTYLGNQACVATMALTKALRLQQIVSGYVPTIDDANEQHAHSLAVTPRLEALRELLETLTIDHKVLIWAVFKENYEQIRNVCRDLGLGYTEVHGEVPGTKKFENVERFNTDPSCRVFIGHPGSGGIGINLVAASYSIFYSRSFSLEYDLQAEARNYRGGSEVHEKITRIDLVAKDTIDELVLEKLAGKQAISDTMLKELKERL